MGAYSPVPLLTAALERRILREIIEPTLAGLAADGLPYTGFLYAGLMIGADGTPRVLEFNCRLGDPEAQPLLARLRSDLPELCHAALSGRLHSARAEWDSRGALGVVLAAPGYPDNVRTGDPISGLEQAAALPGKVFHAGTRRVQDRIVTAGGRVLCAVGLGTDARAAQRQAYELLRPIHFAGMQFRHDIGDRALVNDLAADRGASSARPQP
jgi:phosphoribosylamine--glycine ligase